MYRSHTYSWWTENPYRQPTEKKKLIHVQPDYEMTDAVRDEDIRKALKEKSCKELKED